MVQRGVVDHEAERPVARLDLARDRVAGGNEGLQPDLRAAELLGDRQELSAGFAQLARRLSGVVDDPADFSAGRGRIHALGHCLEEFGGPREGLDSATHIRGYARQVLRLFADGLRQNGGKLGEAADGETQLARRLIIERHLHAFGDRRHVAGDAARDRGQPRDVRQRRARKHLPTAGGLLQLPVHFDVPPDGVATRYGSLPFAEQARLVQQDDGVDRQADLRIERQVRDHEGAVGELHGLDASSSHAAHHHRRSDANPADVAETGAHRGVVPAEVRLLHPQGDAHDHDNRAEHRQTYNEVVGAIFHGFLPSSQMTAQKASRTNIMTAEYTTALVAA